MARREDLDGLYDLLDELRTALGGPRLLRESQRTAGFPRRGMYFFFEAGEFREDGHTPRVVRVGTHAISLRSKTTLWNRRPQHRGALGGSLPGGGNHRDRSSVCTWELLSYTDDLTNIPMRVQAGPEATTQIDPSSNLNTTSSVLLANAFGAMPFTWVPVDDEPSSASDRGRIESNCIALLSNARKPPIDPPSDSRSLVCGTSTTSMKHMTLCSGDA
jgi:hypothetical protein